MYALYPSAPEIGFHSAYADSNHPAAFSNPSPPSALAGAKANTARRRVNIKAIEQIFFVKCNILVLHI